MKFFTEYLIESTKSYNYVIKFAEKPTDEQINVIETWLKKYDLQGMSAPTLVEYAHKDFIDIPNRQVHAVEITLGSPVTSYILLQDLKSATNISEKMITVRGKEEPIERISQFDSWARTEDDKAEAEDCVTAPKLSTNREYLPTEQPQTGPLYGDEYNRNLLSYLAGVAATRPTMEIDPPAPIFTWLKMKDAEVREPQQDVADFNARHNTPKPVSKVSSDVTPVDKKYLNTHGSISDSAIPSMRIYTNKTGGHKQVVKPVEKK